jgi:hypothetical protein
VVGFFWNILLVAVRYVNRLKISAFFLLTSTSSAIFLLVKWILQNKRVSLSIFEKKCSSILNCKFSKPPPNPVDPANAEKGGKWDEINVLKLRAFGRYEIIITAALHDTISIKETWSCRSSHDIHTSPLLVNCSDVFCSLFLQQYFSPDIFTLLLPSLWVTSYLLYCFHIELLTSLSIYQVFFLPKSLKFW